MKVGVAGAGAMGMGVVRSALRCGFATHVRDIRPEVHQEATRHGATCHPSPAALARACDAVVILVVDSAQIEDVLFADDGIAGSGARPIVFLGSTISPEDTAGFARRLAAAGITTIDAPVSGGPQRAADGSMTMMLSGPSEAIERCNDLLRAIAGKVFVVGTRPGDAAKFKIVNNMLAAANLAAAGEAIAIAERAGLDPRLVHDVVTASSGASWIFADRIPRALDGDYAPRAATRILCKDAGLAVDLAKSVGVEAALAKAAQAAFRAAVEDGFGEDDDASIVQWNRRRSGCQ
jgi:3-hydroxyisobutyrate dehydrogenase-like beta-hydroxyacid dehydrogenase